jgi:hypothetical protein
MGYQGEAPESVTGGGGFIKELGIYHFLITEGHDDLGKRKKDGSRSSISGCTLELVCLEGSVDDSAGKSHSETLFYPSPNGSKAANEIKSRAIAALLIATNKMQPSELGGEMAIDQAVIDSMRDCQILMKLRRQKEKDGDGNYTIDTDFLELDFANIYHVDDPDVKGVRKDTEALALIPKEHRHPQDWFEFKKKKGSQPAAAAAAPAASFDDIV